MKHLFTFTITLLLAATVAQAQDTTVATPRRAHHPSALGNNAEYSMHLLYDQPVTSRELIQGCRHLTLDIDATGFFYDAEYVTSMAKGYTVAGFRLSPALAYGINERAQLRIGFNATAFAGLDSLYRLRPTLSLVYAPTQWLTLVAGTIYGSHTHRLDAPVYDPSRWIFNYQEDGLQILTKTKIWNSDTSSTGSTTSSPGPPTRNASRWAHDTSSASSTYKKGKQNGRDTTSTKTTSSDGS
ncbi:MAG: hypothetical protein IKJ40_03285 [Bacteroidales bacterium]|nr:hypothetical protein [Bacteroidales bacterium]